MTAIKPQESKLLENRIRSHFEGRRQIRITVNTYTFSIQNKLDAFMIGPLSELYNALAITNNTLVDAEEVLNEDLSEMEVIGQIQRKVAHFHMAGHITQNHPLALDQTKEIRNRLHDMGQETVRLKKELEGVFTEGYKHAASLLDKLLNMISDHTNWEQTLYDCETRRQDLDACCDRLNDLYLGGKFTLKSVGDKYSEVGKDLIKLHEGFSELSPLYYRAVRETDILIKEFEDLSVSLAELQNACCASRSTKTSAQRLEP